MALRFPFRKCVIPPANKIKYWTPFFNTSIDSISKYKSSSSKSVDKSAVKVTKPNDDVGLPCDAQIKDGGAIHSFGTQSSWESLDTSDFSSFAQKYGEQTEDGENMRSSDIQVVSVSEVLKDLAKSTGRSFLNNVEGDNVTDISSFSHMQNDRTENTISKLPKNVKSNKYSSKTQNDRTGNQITKHQKDVEPIKCSSKPLFTRGRTQPTHINRKKILLINKKKNLTQNNITSLNKENDLGSRKVIPQVVSSSHDGNGVGMSSATINIYDAFEEMEANAKDGSNQTGEINAKNSSDQNVNISNEQVNSGKMSTHRKNCLGIQMLSPSLYDQIFSKVPPKHLKEAEQDFLRSKMHLQDQALWDREPSVMADYNLHIPSLLGSDLEQHFYLIAEEQCGPYKELLNMLVGADLPDFPSHWQYTPGWTRYNSDGTFLPVDHPECRALVFDVEVCVGEGGYPTLAAAVSDRHWYSWCSNQLISDGDHISEVTVEDLIPLECSLKSVEKANKESGQIARVVVGHNVSYDRLRVGEQYRLEGSALRFVDTMSLHIAVSGLVSEQRALVMKNRTSETKVRLPWMSVGCQNNLNDVYKFYCQAKDDLKKDSRNVFVKGNLSDVRNDFQGLMTYCANDVKATLLVLQKLLPLFFERFPHPVTFSGMLEMGSTFLPVTENWSKYVDAAETKYHSLERLLNEELARQAQEALSLKENDQYKRDPWLWNLDWSVPKGRVKILPGYPNWYRKLCARSGEREGTPEPENMSTSLQVVPKILRLTWDGFPLHHERKYGWGYLKPLYRDVSEIRSNDSVSADNQVVSEIKGQNDMQFPIDALLEICSGKKLSLDEAIQARNNRRLDSPETEEDWQLLLSEDKSTDKTTKRPRKQTASIDTNAEERSLDIGIPGVAFVPLPHKDGPGNRVGNPLAKDFLNKIEDNTLSSYHGDIAKLVLKTNKILSYWKNNRDRILSQMVLWNRQQNSQDLSSNSDAEESSRVGVILPMVVSAGTITRRAVERTWMTASNAYADRIGSELKAMVEAPPGYKFVGADVDSQELWIAAILGDAYFSSEHGATALGWMTLQGKKSDGSDMHSRTADMAGISRDHAKVINYGRIYGAGVNFTQRLLKQFNHSLSDAEAQHRATSLFEATKGRKGWVLNEKGEEIANELHYPFTGEAMSRKEVNKFLRKADHYGIDSSFEEIVDGSPIWVGGSESHMFNCLEAIARSETPRTPVLGARMTRALEPKYADDQFMTSRVNWVVQSSAVDYLHLMLVSMQWLFKKYDIAGRFSISIHDEVRYLVASDDCYRAALALQITNLLTRSLFAMRLGFKDLPQSVAFFSSVDIDAVMRKEPHLDCVTPSNPEGLMKGYGIPPGESLDIEKILQITKGKLNKIEVEQDQHNPER